LSKQIKVWIAKRNTAKLQDRRHQMTEAIANQSAAEIKTAIAINAALLIYVTQNFV